MRYKPQSPELTPDDPQKLEMWNFIHSRPRLTRAEIAEACQVKDTKRENYLRALARDGVLRKVGREGITHFYSVLDEQTMKAELAAEQPETLTREQHLLLAAASSFISFTPPDLQGTLPEASARDLKAALDGLLNQGHLRRVRSNGTVVTYSAHSPKAAHSLARQRRKTAPGAMWQAIRIQKRFTAQDIHVALATSRPDITVRSAQDYCTMLTRAGYLRATQKARKDRPARYLLIRDTGPLPPVEKRLPVVIDGNDDVIVHAQGGRLV